MARDRRAIPTIQEWCPWPDTGDARGHVSFQLSADQKRTVCKPPQIGRPCGRPWRDRTAPPACLRHRGVEWRTSRRSLYGLDQRPKIGAAPGLKTGIVPWSRPQHGEGSLRNRHRELIVRHVQAPAAGDMRNDDTKVVHGQRARALGTIESKAAPERSSIVPTRL